jgi:hypothetical protein
VLLRGGGSSINTTFGKILQPLASKDSTSNRCRAARTQAHRGDRSPSDFRANGGRYCGSPPGPKIKNADVLILVTEARSPFTSLPTIQSCASSLLLLLFQKRPAFHPVPAPFKRPTTRKEMPARLRDEHLRVARIQKTYFDFSVSLCK